jgi:hypothetical protein
MCSKTRNRVTASIKSGYAIPQSQVRGRPMATRKQLHTAEAVSAAVRIDKDEPTMAYVNFRLSSGDHLDIGMGRHVLERILAQAKRAIEGAPLLARKR